MSLFYKCGSIFMEYEVQTQRFIITIFFGILTIITHLFILAFIGNFIKKYFLGTPLQYYDYMLPLIIHTCQIKVFKYISNNFYYILCFKISNRYNIFSLVFQLFLSQKCLIFDETMMSNFVIDGNGKYLTNNPNLETYYGENNFCIQTLIFECICNFT